jgi:hypothetical protein
VLPYVEDIDVERIHVEDPFDVVLLCGGQYGDIGDPTPKSLRDAFLKILPYPKSLKGKEIIKAEEVTKEYGFHKSYDDILAFETDLAQIVDLIIIFCESEGSLAELGAFSMIDEILKRLFVVIREKHWNEASFVKLGPLRCVERRVGREAIQVVADQDVGLEGKSAANVDKNKLAEMLDDALARRLQSPKEPTTFNQSYAGHIIKLIVGFVQEYGALTLAEIQLLLNSFSVNVSDDRLRGYLLCAIAVKWMAVIPKGGNDYYVQTSASSKGKEAATLRMKEGAKEKNKQRRRLAIRQHWEKNDKVRYAAIKQAGCGGQNV